uniref:Uncharacterized protein n=1 Tax=Meloidogyne hapla TaxID=6305 RepID=A0A1I8AZF1_MELHA
MDEDLRNSPSSGTPDDLSVDTSTDSTFYSLPTWPYYGPEMTLRQLVDRVQRTMKKQIEWLESGYVTVFKRNDPPNYMDMRVDLAVLQAELAYRPQRTATREGAQDRSIRFKTICEECESLLESEGGFHQSHQICQHIIFNKSVNKNSKVARVNSRLGVFGRRAKRSSKAFRLVNNRIRFKAFGMAAGADRETDHREVLVCHYCFLKT